MAKYRPHAVGLQRVLGTRSLAATAYGDVGSSIYYALGLVAIFALGMTPIVYLIAGLFFVMTAMTYAEATANFPEAGGASSFARRAFNELASFVAGWAQILNYVITVSISAFFVPHYLAVFWTPLGDGPWDVVGGIVVVLALTAVNVIGVRESAGVNLFLAAIDYATQLLLVVLGVFAVLSVPTLIHNVHLGVAPHWDQLAVAIPVAMVSYTGLETISNMSEEARLPRLMVPRAYRVLVIAVLSIYVLLPAVALSAMPVTHGPDGFTTPLATTYAGDPLLGVVKNIGLGPLQAPLSYYVGVLAATILIVAANAGTIGVSRLTYSLGQHRQLPERLGQISARSRTPVAALLVFAGLACLAMVPGQEVFLGNMYAYGAMLSFTTAHVALIGLRWRVSHNRMRKLPGDVEVVNGEDEWFRAPLNMRVRGFDVPVFAVIGGVATAGSWVTVMVLHHDVLLWGSLWMAIGVGGYVAFRHARGLSLTETTRVARPAGPAPVPVAYASTLLVFEENNFSESALATALKLARHRGSTLRVLVTLEVPRQVAINAHLDREEAVAGQMVEAARQWARHARVSGKVVKVRPGEAGRRIVEEAHEAHADAIVMPMPRSTPPGKQLSRALEVVLRERPCRVVIDSERAEPFTPAGSRIPAPAAPPAEPVVAGAAAGR